MPMTAVRFHDALAALLVDADEVRPHPDNAKNGDTDAIVRSMVKNGVYRPVMAQRSTGYVLAGNHTYAALLELGATQVPVVWLDVDTDAARRIMLADNRTADLGRMDDGLLVALLRDTDTAGGLEGTGYDTDDLADLLARLDGPPDLDDLADAYTDPSDDDDTWVTVRLRVPEDVAALWTVAGKATGLTDEMARDCALIRAAYAAVTGGDPE